MSDAHGTRYGAELRGQSSRYRPEAKRRPYRQYTEGWDVRPCGHQSLPARSDDQPSL